MYLEYTTSHLKFLGSLGEREEASTQFLKCREGEVPEEILEPKRVSVHILRHTIYSNIFQNQTYNFDLLVYYLWVKLVDWPKESQDQAFDCMKHDFTNNKKKIPFKFKILLCTTLLMD